MIPKSLEDLKRICSYSTGIITCQCCNLYERKELWNICEEYQKNKSDRYINHEKLFSIIRKKKLEKLLA